MSHSQPDNPLPPGSPREFDTTHWSVILLASSATSTKADTALEYLCRTYWYPLYAYVRRQGKKPEDAQDLTQEFFARLLRKQYLKLADPQRGRFRTFLLTALRHFMTNEWEKSRAAKRGGGEPELSLQAEDAAGRPLAEPVDAVTPDLLYEHHWATALVENVMALLRAEHVAADKLAFFDALKGHVWGEGAEGYAELARRLQSTEGALRGAAHRMRERFRQLLRQEVAKTVTAPEDIDGELRHLISLFRT